MSYNHIMERLMEAMGSTAEKVPAGWFTPAEFRKESGKGVRQAAEDLAKALKMGVVEKRKFRVYNEAQGCLYPTVHYREIKR